MDSQRNTTNNAPHYTVFVRLPFPRNDFEDPPPVEWNSTKDKALWKRISKASNSRDLDWESMTSEFNVTIPFLLQQSAWLYERHFEGMRLQMKKLGASSAATESPALRPVSTDERPVNSPSSKPNAIPMARIGSRDSARASAGTGKATTDSGTASGSQRQMKPLISRNPSTTTITQSRIYNSASKQPLQRAGRRSRGSSGSQNRLTPPLKTIESSHDDDDESAMIQDDTSAREAKISQSHSSDSEVDNHAHEAGGRAVQRPQHRAKAPYTNSMSSDGDGELDEEDENLPFASIAHLHGEDPAATVRNPMVKQPIQQRNAQVPKRPQNFQAPDSSTSSASSAQPPPSAETKDSGDVTRINMERPGALSPRHRAQLEQLSPRYKRSGSEGSPSMGSSFSDLDDTSVTQSALEDALLSNMQHGSIGMSFGSRMNSLRDVLGKR